MGFRDANTAGSSLRGEPVVAPRARVGSQRRRQNGKQKSKRIRNWLVVTNARTTAAEDMTFNVTGVGECSFHPGDLPTEPFTLPPESTRDWLMIPLSSGTVETTAQWTENGEAKSATRTTLIRGR